MHAAAMRQRQPPSPSALEWFLSLFTQQQQQQPASSEEQGSAVLQSASPVQPPVVGNQHYQPAQEHVPPHTGRPASTWSSAGPLKASASQLLAGVPLEQMLQRNAAQRQLQRQQQQLNAGSDDGWWDAAGEATPTGAGGTAGLPSAQLLAPPAPANGANAGTNASGSSLDGSDGSQQAGLSAVNSPEAAMALAAYEDAIAHRRTVQVVFKLRHRAEPGQRVKVVGGHASLGRWALGEAPELQRCAGDVWQAAVKLPAGVHAQPAKKPLPRQRILRRCFPG